jgi:exopolyphosphatase/guanosine-5'-triphosphate,3'-diphosphate pyrophosphatase
LGHEGYSVLSQGERVIVSKLAALLRIAKALDAGRNQIIREIHTGMRVNSLIVEVPGVTDLSLEQLEMRRQQDLFEYVFGGQVELRHASDED